MASHIHAKKRVKNVFKECWVVTFMFPRGGTRRDYGICVAAHRMAKNWRTLKPRPVDL